MQGNSIYHVLIDEQESFDLKPVSDLHVLMLFSLTCFREYK